MKIDKNTRRVKEIHHHLNIQPPCSLDSEEDVFNNPFVASKLAKNASYGAPAGPAISSCRAQHYDEEESDEE